MKKIVLLVMVLVITIVVTGCSKKKTLICTTASSGVDIEFKIEYLNDKIETMNINYDMNLSSYSDKQIKYIEKQKFCNSIKATMSNYKKAFTDCSQKIEKKHLIVEAALNPEKISKAEMKKMNSIDDFKKSLEKQNYKCEIK